jgi:hypothetical protein
MVGMGLLITFIALGENGLRTLWLKLMGPSLVGCGVVIALLRILLGTTAPSCVSGC